MSFETGGRSDKRGNVYENRYLAKTLVRLINEDIRSVVVEPVGENTDICEFYTVGKDGRKTYFQCKGSNEMKDHWTPSDLQKYNLFSKVQKLLRSDPECSFHFISPLYYSGLDELCSRAKTYPSAEDYLKYALSNKQLRDVFKACEKYFNLDRSNSDQLNELVNLLSRCEFIVYPNNSETIQHLEDLISVHFWGVVGKTRVLLENYVNDTSSYGKELTVSDVLNYLAEKDIQLRTHLPETRISPAISRLNKSFYESYNAIQDTIFHRESTDLLIQEIEAGKSIVLHGKAGTGKSGCVRELINHLERNHIDYLAIQLDKHMPNDFADKYGESLGLSGSPVSCLSLLSGSKPCVLILDQLDALRWTALHSSVALDVCKEMIAQARGINEYTDGRVSIVFSVRTFDYENDIGIQSLFRDETKEESPWSVIDVKSLTDNEVIQIVGEEYKQLPGRVKELIHIPSSLYVWLKLDPGKRMNRIESSQDMVLSWWKQIQDNYAATGHNQASLSDCISEVVTAISNSSSFALPRSMFLRYTQEIDYLASGGMLIVKDNISFVHQSFLDSFLLAKDLKAIFSGSQDLLSLVLSWGVQMPMYRYRLSALFQYVAESNQSLFACQVKEFLESERIHYYYKAAVFETIGQLSAPVPEIIKIIDTYFENPEWHGFILQTVYDHHPVFINHLSEQQGFDWLSKEGYPLLVSMRYFSPSSLVKLLREKLKSDTITPEQAISVLGTEIDVESEEAFSLRMEMYEKDYSLLSSIHFINYERAQPKQILQIIALFLSNTDSLGAQRVYIEEKERLQFCKENYSIIIETLFEPLCISARKTPLSLHTTVDFRDRYWLPRQSESSIARKAVDLVKSSLKILAINNPEEALQCVYKAGKFRNGISNELALSTLLELPSNYSNAVIEWILSDFDCHILDCISNEYDYLSTCKDILKKHSQSCSEELFSQLEERICTWKGDRERFLDNYKYRINVNRTPGQGPLFWPAWGHLQKDLLPFLSPDRTTQKTKDLLAVLNRNEWVRSNNYHAGILSGPARSVVSTIHQNATKLSDKTWLEIINTNVDEQHSGFRDTKGDNEFYYESSHWAFAQDLGSCVKNNPTRYSKLLLRLPQDCFSGYYSSVLYSLGNSGVQAIDFSLLCDVIRHSIKCSSDTIPLAIAQIINRYVDKTWPEDITAYLVEIATGNLKPIGNEKISTSTDDDPFPSPDEMEIAVLNSPRGAAVDTIGTLLLNHPESLEIFAPTIEKLAQDESDVIRFALVKCAAAYYEHDTAFSAHIFDTIIKRDPMALCARYSFWLMRKDLQVLEEYYYPLLKNACYTPNPKLVTHLAQLICVIAILTSNEGVLSFLYSHPWSKETLDKICLEATYGFENEDYRTISKTILEYFLTVDASSLHSIDRLFHEHRLDLQRDDRFIKTILQKRSSTDTIDAFIGFIKTQDVTLSGFVEIIQTAVESLDEDIHIWQKHRIEDGLVHAVIRLIDTARGDNELMECCLDILDKIFQKRILTDTLIYELLDGTC